MSEYQKILLAAHMILAKYPLCSYCLGRLFLKQLHLLSYKPLGKKLQISGCNTDRCYICKDLFAHLDNFLKMMLEASYGYQGKSFSVGVMIKPSIIDRDDNIRSQYKLRGADGIKTGITRELAKIFSKKTKMIVDHLDPDLTITLNLKDQTCQTRSKSVVVSGRYTKTQRGLPQKQKSCDNCCGHGCRTCNFHGIAEFDSVEGVISGFIFEQFGNAGNNNNNNNNTNSNTAKFTWIGGEDSSSLVLGCGRPFFVKIQNPCARTLSVSDACFDAVQIMELKIIPRSPVKPLKFSSLVRLCVHTASRIDSTSLRRLKSLQKVPILVYNKSGKRSEKRISSLKYRRNSENTFTLMVDAQGGLPVKRFVSSDDVTPGVSEILGLPCVCKQFDIVDVTVQ